MTFFLRGSAGLLVWSAGFSALYALHGLGCAMHWADYPLPGGTLFGWTLLLTWAAFLLAAAGILLWSFRSSAASRFEQRLTQVSAIAGLLALLVSGLPILFISACV